MAYFGVLLTKRGRNGGCFLGFFANNHYLCAVYDVESLKQEHSFTAIYVQL